MEVATLGTDHELDRLKTISDDTYDRKNHAWKKQDDLWKKLQSLSSSYSPTIERLSREHDQAFEAMKSCFERASSAYSSKDHSSASNYSSQGRAYKAQLSGLVN